MNIYKIINNKLNKLFKCVYYLNIKDLFNISYNLIHNTLN